MGVRVVRGWPLPVWVFPGVAVVMAVLTCVVNLSLLQSEYPMWFEVSTAWHEGLWIPGAVLVMLAVPIGAALAQRASPVTPGGRPREGVGLMLAHAGALGVWAVVGHVVGMAPAVVRASVGATWGVLNWRDVVIGSVGVVLLVVVGFGAGALLRRWLFAPVVGVVMFAALTVPDSVVTRPLGLFSPVRQYTASTRFEPTVATTVFGIIAMVCVVLAIVHGVTWFRRRSAVYQNQRQWWVWGVTVGALVGVAFVWRPELYTVAEPVPRICESEGSVQICLHQANEPARSDITSVTAELSQAGLGPLLQHVSDEAASDTLESQTGEAILRIHPGPFATNLAFRSVREGVAGDISQMVTDQRCPFTEEVFFDTEDDPAEPSRALRWRVLMLAGFERLAEQNDAQGPAAVFFGAMDAGELTKWVQQHQDQINTCTITVDQDQ